MVSKSGKIIAEALAQMKKVKEAMELMIEMNHDLLVTMESGMF